MEEFVSQALRGPRLQAARHVRQPERRRRLLPRAQRLPSSVHPADGDQRALMAAQRWSSSWLLFFSFCRATDTVSVKHTQIHHDCTQRHAVVSQTAVAWQQLLSVINVDSCQRTFYCISTYNRSNNALIPNI